MSQLDVALEAEISSRHLSFVETGRSQPSRDMGLLLAQVLEVPLRSRLPTACDIVKRGGTHSPLTAL